jgi:hypothetical protein
MGKQPFRKLTVIGSLNSLEKCRTFSGLSRSPFDLPLWFRPLDVGEVFRFFSKFGPNRKMWFRIIFGEIIGDGVFNYLRLRLNFDSR